MAYSAITASKVISSTSPTVALRNSTNLGAVPVAPGAACPAPDRLEAHTAATAAVPAARTASTGRQPRYSEAQVPSGTPSAEPAARPLVRLARALPWRSGGTRPTTSTAARGVNWLAPAAVSARPSIATSSVPEQSVTTLPAATAASATQSTVCGAVRPTVRDSNGPSTA